MQVTNTTKIADIRYKQWLWFVRAHEGNGRRKTIKTKFVVLQKKKFNKDGLRKSWQNGQHEEELQNDWYGWQLLGVGRRGSQTEINTA